MRAISLSSAICSPIRYKCPALRDLTGLTVGIVAVGDERCNGVGMLLEPLLAADLYDYAVLGPIV